MTLLDHLRQLFAPAITALSPDHAKVPDYLAMIKPTVNAANGDYQANMAMPLGKLLGQKPQDAANAIIAALPKNDVIESASVAGPGFINLKLTTNFLAKNVQAMAGDDRLGIPLAPKPKTIALDYSSPNVAKPLHVGHLRSTVIGDALARINRFLGHRVITDNHLGDWGTQFGMLLYGYKNLLNAKSFAENPVQELSRIYVLVRNITKAFDAFYAGYHKHRKDPALQADPLHEIAKHYASEINEAKESSEDEDDAAVAVNPIAEIYRKETAKLHAGDAENLALWVQFMPHCMKEIQSIYDRLGILPFDHYHGESFYNPMLPGVVEDLLAKNVAEIGDGGAIIVRTGKDNVSLIRKRDGAFTYTTSDLATIQYRAKKWQPDIVLYVVDFRQGHHFSTLFAIAKKWGYELNLQHISFGSVLGKDGRPLQTRKGTTFDLADLLDEAEELGANKYRASYEERKAHGHVTEMLTEETIRDIGHAIGIGAVKYADLSQNRTSDYKYDAAKMLATDGNTATYMQYAYARGRSIFRKGDIDDAKLRLHPPNVILTSPAERNLALQLLRFGEALENAAAESLPHLLTTYLWDLARAYSQFFEQCPVLTAETSELKASRLLLVDLVTRTIKTTLDLLGIRVVERM